MELQDQLIELCAEKNKTVLMVTHDVDEALLLADRIVLMTNGPAATVGEIVTVPFERRATGSASAKIRGIIKYAANC
jgi:ABC-type nitrate/sulfonate/bicarbonate transport system ATPase subunit